MYCMEAPWEGCDGALAPVSKQLIIAFSPSGHLPARPSSGTVASAAAAGPDVSPDVLVVGLGVVPARGPSPDAVLHVRDAAIQEPALGLFMGGAVQVADLVGDDMV